jgi:SAM-dependent methyltransferase
MQTELYYSGSPQTDHWEGMWTARTVEQEQDACDIELPPRDLLLSYLPKGGRVLDAGCGFGKWLVYLARRGYDIVGIDSSELAIAGLKEYDGSLQVEVGDILHIEYPDDSFDAYVSMGVVEHFEGGPMAALAEARRVLKPGGLAFVSVPTVNHVRQVIRRPMRNAINAFPLAAIDLVAGWRNCKRDAVRAAVGRLLPEAVTRVLLRGTTRYRHFLEYRYTRCELEGFLVEAGFEVLRTVPHDFSGSRDHAIGLAVDFPWLRAHGGANFKVNLVGKAVSVALDRVSPWMACSSVLCVGRVVKG